MSDVPFLFKLTPAVLNYESAAAYLGISPGRLRNLMWLGIGPKKISYGKRDVRFRVQDLNEFIASKAEQFPNNEGIKRPRGRPRKVPMPSVYDMDGGDVRWFFEVQDTLKLMDQITYWDIFWRITYSSSFACLVLIIFMYFYKRNEKRGSDY
ncbi:helix-turn-helix transcriptional regulator [Acetobacter thailandicus]|uniref:Helix-turn-helix domain-containing protein n=1 Tax=Acetobacter thailandicus TaxID=1502842 RepID=A0ABT3QEI8_9PROT|nr:helix-turn-helix domain-containing protein [Acetobacter thailandicus]MCX2563701.1 helix-turn-helix domain-containing protein [Acetobacter thailandicus]NHN95227.1 hypothetical protein [Acetobacter thailandicus]